MTKSISVIIPNFNGKELLEENLPYVLRSLEEVPKSEIIIIDDASTDDSKEFLKESYPEIIIIKNAKNLGFGSSINAGLKKAKHELVLLLNSDIRPDNKYILASLDYFEDPETFGVMGIIKDEVTGEILEGIKWPWLSISGIKYKDLRMPEIEKLDKKIYTLYICGGNAIVNREKMLELQGFLDIYHPFYLEDVDLSIRAWLSGWKLYFNPDTYCFHKHSATINKYFSKDFINLISKRNRLILSWIYLPGFYKFLFRMATYVKSLYYKFLYEIGLSKIYPGYREFLRMRGKLSVYQPPLRNSRKIGQVIGEIRRNIGKKLN